MAKNPVPSKPSAAANQSTTQVLTAGILLALILLAAGIGYYAYRMLHPSMTPINTAAANGNTNQTTIDDNANGETNVNVSGTTVGQVSWQTAKELPLVKLFTSATTPDTPDTGTFTTPDATATLTQVGTVNSGSFKGATVIRYAFREDGPIRYDTFYYLLRQGSKYTLLTKSSNQVYSYEGGPQLNTKVLTVDDTYELADLRFPETLTGPKSGQTLLLDPTVNDLFSNEHLVKVFTDKTYGQVYMAPVTIGTLPGGVDYNSNASVEAFLQGSAFSTRNGFYLRAPDGTVRVYRLQPDIITSSGSSAGSGTVPITWMDGTNSAGTYNFATLSGCGATNYTTTVSPSELTLKNDLQQVGTARTGAAIYALKDQQAKILKDFYASTSVYDPGTGTSQQPNYVEFVGSRPILFWVDPFDRLIELTNTKYTPLAECGKPVIYLYPSSTTNVDVHLEPRGGFTYTEPTYVDGWQVTARPNGQLTERRSGRTYPYLFWEGRGGLYTEPTQGFVVAQADVHGFLTSSLLRLGLNTHESADFIEFWKPRMQGSPYYRVTFLGNRTMDELAPLSISPKPDTIIRILMDFKPLPAPATLAPQTLRAPTRRGFTVVEWGGVLR